MPARARLAVIGHRAELGTCLPPASAGLDVVWVERPHDPDPERLLADVTRLAPDLVLALEPRAGEGELLRRCGAPAVAWLIADTGDQIGGFDQLLAVSRTAAARAADASACRIEPLPVSDALFAPIRPPATLPRVFFDGPTSARRDTILQPVKHRFDVLHLAGGGSPERLAELQGRCDVALDLRDEPGVGLRDRVGTALAAGLLLIAERPLERPGLGAGVQLLSFGELWELDALLVALRRHPEAMVTLRARGRHLAEARRASAAWPRLAGELLAAG